MICPHCNQQHSSDLIFCPLTGKKLSPPGRRPIFLWFALAAGGLGLFLAGALVAVYIFFSATRESPVPLLLNTAPAPSQPAFTHTPPPSVSPTPAPSTSPGQIVFESNRDGNLEIYRMNAGGGELTRLTDHPAADAHPAWSPDGQRIAFTSNRDGNWEIYVMQADGSRLRNLTQHPADDAYPSWSPDGQKIAFTSNRDGHPQIYLMAADGSQQTRLTTSSSQDSFPNWSPDGQYIVFQSASGENFSDFQITRINHFGSGRTTIGPYGVSSLYPAWSPDGKQLVFLSKRGSSWKIHRMASDGSGQVELPQPPSQSTNTRIGPDFYTDNGSAGWSPDGQKIVFVSAPDGNAEIYTMNPDGSAPLNLTNNPAFDGFPDWSPGASAANAVPAQEVTPVPAPPVSSNLACAFHPLKQFFEDRLNSKDKTAWGLSCLEDSGWHSYQPDASADLTLPPAWINHLPQSPWPTPVSLPPWMAQCPDGQIYLTLDQRLFKLEGARLTELTPDGYEDAQLPTCGPNNDLWLVLSKKRGQGMYPYSGNFDPKAPHKIDSNVMLSHYNGSVWTHYPTLNNLGSKGFIDLINTLTFAPNGQLWVATGSSIAAFDGANWQFFEEGRGFTQSIFPDAMAFDTNGSLWVLNNIGLLKYDGKNWTAIEKGVPQDIYYAKHLLVDRDNKLWVDIDYRGLIYTYDPQNNRWTQKISKGQLSSDRITSLQFDASGRLWIVTHYGLDIYDGQKVTAYHMHSADLYTNSIDSLIVFGQGPQLPPLLPRPPGSIHGRLVNSDPQTYAKAEISLCPGGLGSGYFASQPCLSAPNLNLPTVKPDPQGNFTFNEIPVGLYYLIIKSPKQTWVSKKWFEVQPGAALETGDTLYPPK